MKKAISILLAAILLTAGTLPYAAAGHYDSAAGGHVCDHGYYTLGDKKLQRGVKSRFYWTDPTLAKTEARDKNTKYTYVELVSYAFSYWNNTYKYSGVSTPIMFNQDNSQPKVTLEIWQKNDLDFGVLGTTAFWYGPTEINIRSDGSLPLDYTQAKIYISPNALNTYISDNSQRRATIIHEIGHAMGLSHRNNVSSSIMCQATNRTATYPSPSDCYAIRHLYPESSYK